MGKKVSDKIVENTFYNIIGRVWTILVNLILTPYIVSQLGVEKYGLWALAFGLTGYIGLLDLGVSSSYVKYISQYYTQKEYHKINQIVNTGFFFSLVFAFIFIIIGYFIIPPFISFLKIPLHLQEEAFFVFFAGVIIFTLSNATYAFAAVQPGLQKMKITNLISLLFTLPYAAGVIWFLESGWGVRGLILNYAILWLLSVPVNIFVAKKIFPEFNVGFNFYEKSILKNLINFGAKLQVSRLAQLVSFQVDKIFLTYFLSVSSVTYYDLGARVVGFLRGSVLLLVSALMPAASELAAKGLSQSLKELYLRATKYLMFASLPVFWFTVLLSDKILEVWVGPGYEMGAGVVRILALGYFLNLCTGVASPLALGMGKPELEMKSGFLLAGLNISLSLALVLLLGFYGPPTGSSFSLGVSALYFFWLFHKILEEKKSTLLEFLKKPFWISLILIFLLWMTNYIIPVSTFTQNRISGILFLGIEFSVYGILYLYLIGKSRYWNQVDLQFFQERLPGAKLLLRWVKG